MSASTAENYSQTARQWMVDGQLATNKLTDAALEKAFAEIPREAFVPAEFAQSAYVDEPLPLGEGRYMVEPMALATWLQGLALQATDSVLVLGATTGYSAALMSGIVASIAVHDEERFAAPCKEALKALKISNVSCPAQAEDNAVYDAILLEGSIEILPETLQQQLKEGGRIAYATPLTPHGHMARLIVAEKRGGTLHERVLSEAPVPRLPGFEKPKGFQFA